MGMFDKKCNKCRATILDGKRRIIASIACMHRPLTESDWECDPRSPGGRVPRNGLASKFDCFCFRCYGQVAPGEGGFHAACPICGMMCWIRNPEPLQT